MRHKSSADAGVVHFEICPDMWKLCNKGVDFKIYLSALFTVTIDLSFQFDVMSNLIFQVACTINHIDLRIQILVTVLEVDTFICQAFQRLEILEKGDERGQCTIGII